MSDSVPRDVLKWLHSLDLSFTIKRPKRDVSNGYIVAEILSRFNTSIPLHSFANGSSLSSKIDNWNLLEKYFKQMEVDVGKETIAAVIQNDDGYGAVTVLAALYRRFSGKKNTAVVIPMPNTKSVQQDTAPSFARPTAAKLLRDVNGGIKDKFKTLLGKIDETTMRNANEGILQSHMEDITKEKLANPERFIPAPRRRPSQDKSKFTKSVKESNIQPIAIEVKTTEDTFIRERVARSTMQREGRVETDKLGIKTVAETSITAVLSSSCEEGFVECNELPARSESNYMSYFITNLLHLQTQVKNVIWSTLVRRATDMADVVLHRPSEYSKLTLALQFMFDRELSSTCDYVYDFDCDRARMIISSIGEEMLKIEPNVTALIARTVLLPLCLPALRGKCPNRRMSALSMLISYFGSLPPLIRLLDKESSAVKALCVSQLTTIMSPLKPDDLSFISQSLTVYLLDANASIRATGIFILHNLLRNGEEGADSALYAKACELVDNAEQVGTTFDLKIELLRTFTTLLTIQTHHTSKKGSLQTDNVTLLKTFLNFGNHPSTRLPILCELAPFLEPEVSDTFLDMLFLLPQEVRLKVLNPSPPFETVKIALPRPKSQGNLLSLAPVGAVIRGLLSRAAKESVHTLREVLLSATTNTPWDMLDSEAKMAWWGGLKDHVEVISNMRDDEEVDEAITTLYMRLSGMPCDTEESVVVAKARTWLVEVVSQN
eukprot:PhF_6_TR40342/c0_g1_i1/m.60002